MSKSLSVRNEFIQRRAQGESYSKIASALHISKSTCSVWEAELSKDISLRKQEELNALYEQYGMMKAARVKRLGDTLNRIDAAIAQIDFTTVDPVKLLDMKLKYSAALKEEYTGATEALLPEEDRATPSNIYYAYNEVYARIRNGELSPAQAKLELESIGKIATSYDHATQPFMRIFGIDGKQTLEDLLLQALRNNAQAAKEEAHRLTIEATAAREAGNIEEAEALLAEAEELLGAKEDS